MTTPADANANPYDAVPYRSYPYAQTSPGRLAAIAAVMGVDAAAPGKARVLELGCCSGGNLLPMAEQYPGGRFVGIDASGRQIDDGQADVDACGLANLRLVQLDIRDIGPELGEFDYIIAHGVYSWVPQDVQRKLLHVCRENLAPNGVAYVSYNTHPGWRMRGIIRDVMRFRARSFQQPADRIRHARALVDLLASAVPSEENAYGMLLKRELEMLRDKDDHYLLHDHLEEDNEPIYFHEFAARAKAEGLQYLGEADFGTMSPRNLPGQIATVIEGLSADVIELEQYMDFVRNRMFRQTLLCRAELPVNRVPSPERVARLWVAS